MSAWLDKTDQVTVSAALAVFASHQLYVDGLDAITFVFFFFRTFLQFVARNRAGTEERGSTLAHVALPPDSEAQTLGRLGRSQASTA